MSKNQMTFWDHFEELRVRLVRCLWIFFGGFIGAYFCSDRLLSALRYPLFRYLPPDKQHLYYTGLFENFLVHLKISGYASAILFSPIYFWILWGFVSPGLREQERKEALPFIGVGGMFFLFGAAFAYFVLFPAGVKYFLHYGTEAEVAWLTLDNYVSLVLKILFGFGVAFQLPVGIVLAARLGLVNEEQLKAHRKTAIIAVTVISALVAPPDAISMLLMMAPLYVLFEGAVVVVRYLQKTPYNTTESSKS